MDHQTIDSNDQSVSNQGRRMGLRDRGYICLLPHHFKLYVCNQLATGLVTRSERSYICMQVITNLFESELWSRAAEENTRNMPLLLFFCRASCTLSFRFSRLTAKSYLVVANHEYPPVPGCEMLSTLNRGVPPPVKYHDRQVEEVSWRPKPEYCMFDLHEVWSRNTTCFTPYERNPVGSFEE